MFERPTRRQLLKLWLVTAGPLSAACGGDDLRESAPRPASDYFPQSVASGDPRPTSVVLWTRVVDPDKPGERLDVTLVVATDEGFEQRLEVGDAGRELKAEAGDDYCVKVRLTGLEPSTHYYYRFEYRADGVKVSSKTGRTRTAPAPDSDERVRFAVVCCQDYGGKYYHVYRDLLDRDVQFFVHLGDYVYETTGDPTFQSDSDTRRVSFSAPEEALDRGGYLAARSLGNYRDLYRTYRSDPDLQAVHERYPMIAVWDDHEFSDDCHGQTATYEDGRTDERDPERRRAADRAWFEYMPVDYATAPAAPLDEDAEFPEDFSIYRSFVFGRHLELVMTDLRRFRPDHLVPEDAFPGRVFLDEAELESLLGEVPDDSVPYVSIESFEDGRYASALREHAEELGIRQEDVTGLVSAVYVNRALEMLAGDAPPAIDVSDSSLERGYAYHCLLKTEPFSRLGSRYVLAVQPFYALARARYAETEGRSERMMGEAQREWFLQTIAASERTFKVWGSEVGFLQRHVDLTGVTLAPPEFQRRLTISADDWDGFPNERAALLEALHEAGNVVILSGDLHCFFAGTPCDPESPETRVVEFLTGSVSSMTWLDGIEGIVAADPSLPMSARQLVRAIDILLTDRDIAANPHLAHQELGRNGYSVVEVGPEALEVAMRSISPEDVASPKLPELDAAFEEERFRVLAGASDLYREIDGEYRRWDMRELAYE